MWPYTDTENSWLRDSNAPNSSTIDGNWPSVEEVEHHHRNAEIIRSEAVADAAFVALAFIRTSWRKIRGLPAKLRTGALEPGATA